MWISPKSTGGTTDVNAIVARVFGFYDDFGRPRVSGFSPILSNSYPPLPGGPDNPVISIIAQSGATQDPILTLALSANGPPTEMLISDNPSLSGTWKPYATSKDFRTDGTQYIYAEFRDPNNSGSAIAFARPPRVMYIQKSQTIAGRPVLVNVRVAAGFEHPGRGQALLPGHRRDRLHGTGHDPTRRHLLGLPDPSQPHGQRGGILSPGAGQRRPVQLPCLKAPRQTTHSASQPRPFWKAT